MNRFAIAAIPLTLAACSFGSKADSADPGIPGQGSGNARTYAASGFDSVDLRGSDDVEVRVGSGFSVRADGDAKALERLRITRDGSTLRVDRREGSGWTLGESDAKVLVTMPRIAAARLAGSGDLSIDRAEGARFEGSLAGSGNLSVETLQVDETKLSIAGSGNIKAGGRAARLEVSIAGSGNLQGNDLETKSAKVGIAGSGNVKAKLDGEGEVRVAGSGDVDLGRNARCTIRATGSGTVRCGG